jgi:hypothetical protein
VPDGSAILPPVCYSSESSLGLYRSAASTLALSYGQFSVPDGSAILPSVRYASEASLGIYRSAASQLAHSYGTLNSTGFKMAAAGILDWSLGHVVSRTTTIKVSLLAQIPDGGFMFMPGTAGAGSDSSLVFRSGNTAHVFRSTETIALA